MKAKCINNESYERLLTIGKVYEVKEDLSDGKKYAYFCFTGDNGAEGLAYQKRFEVVKELVTNLTKKQKSVNPLFLNQFSRKQLRELAKQLGVKPGKDKWDTMSNLCESGKLTSTITIEVKQGE